MKKILVTGASGYLALHTILQLLKKDLHVKGTVRNISRADEIHQALKDNDCSIKNLELVQVDLLQEEGWDEAFKDITHVLHMAAAFTSKPLSTDEYMKPQLDGTKRILDLCKKYNVKQLIQTSSFATVYNTKEPKITFNENDWSDTSIPSIADYDKSKTLAEKLCWDFIADNQPSFSFTSINPAGIIGPSLSSDLGVTNDFIEQIVKGKIPLAPKMHLGWVHVEDVALAHVNAIDNPKVAGERVILYESALWFKDIGQILHDAGFKKAPTKEMANWMVKVFGLFDASTKLLVPYLGKEKNCNSQKATELLGMYTKTSKQAFIEAATKLTSNLK